MDANTLNQINKLLSDREYVRATQLQIMNTKQIVIGTDARPLVITHDDDSEFEYIQLPVLKILENDLQKLNDELTKLGYTDHAPEEDKASADVPVVARTNGATD